MSDWNVHTAATTSVWPQHGQLVVVQRPCVYCSGTRLDSRGDCRGCGAPAGHQPPRDAVITINYNAPDLDPHFASRAERAARRRFGT